MSKVILISLQCFLLWGFALARPGLWHGVDDKNGDTAFFLYLDGDRSRLYAPQWFQETDLVVDGDRIRFRLPYKSYGIRFDGKRVDGNLAGDWQIHQVQYVVNGTWTAKEVFAAPNWEPWGFLEAEDPAIDVLGKVLSQEFKSFDSFQSIWRRDIEPAYFVLLAESSYADRRGEYRPSLREERLKQIYEFLQSGKGLSAWNRKLLEAVPRVRETLKEKYPWIEKLPVAVVFSGGEFDYRPIRIADKQFTLLGAEWFLELKNEQEMRRFVGEGLISSFHSVVVPLRFSGQTEVIRRSIAIQALEQFKFESGASPEPAADTEFEGIKERIRQDLNLPFQDFYASHLTGPGRLGAYQIFQDFGRFLTTGRDSAELFTLNKEDLTKALTDFFGMSK